jgi:hypothetical protein
MPDSMPELRPTNISPPPRWRLKLVKPDGSRESDRHFHDLRTLLAAAGLLREERPDVRLVITVPVEASDKDREIIKTIADRVPQNTC